MTDWFSWAFLRSFKNTCTTSSLGAFLGGGPLPFGASGAAANNRVNELLVLTLLCLQLSLTIKFLDDVDDLAIFGLEIYALDNDRVMTKRMAMTTFDNVIILIWENYEECTDIFQRCSSL
jgi:hypothetical protein